MILQTPMDELRQQLSMSNSRRSRWKLAEQTVVIRTYTKPCNVTGSLNTPGAQEAEDDIQQLTPTPENNTQGLGEQ